MWFFITVFIVVLVIAWFRDPPFEKKAKPPPYVQPPPKPRDPNALMVSQRFVHRGNYHNVYWTTGNNNQLKNRNHRPDGR
jgi:hypothetical protein